MTPPAAPPALGTATRSLVAALMLGAIALAVCLRAAPGEAALYALPSGAQIRSEP